LSKIGHASQEEHGYFFLQEQNGEDEQRPSWFLLRLAGFQRHRRRKRRGSEKGYCAIVSFMETSVEGRIEE